MSHGALWRRSARRGPETYDCGPRMDAITILDKGNTMVQLSNTVGDAEVVDVSRWRT